MAAQLTLTSIANNPSAVNLTALTGGAAGGLNLGGFNGADYMSQDRMFQNGRAEGGEQLRYTLFADAGALPTYAGEIGGNLADGGNFGGWNVDGANKGAKFTPIASRSMKTLTCALYCDTANAFTIKAHFQDGSYADATRTLATGTGERWWQAVFVGNQENTFMDFEIRSTGAGFFRIQYMYIGVPVAPFRPRGLRP